MITTDKESINRLVEICRQRGVEDVIFSPGSRNAPLVIAFHAAEYFTIKTIPDERVAAFYALGQAIATGKPSVICCTSGSAVLNYAPAIVEAYYQRVPLLVLTADRPSAKIDQGVGQSMRQNKVYANYIKKSYSWMEEAQSDKELHKNDQIISEALAVSIANPPGPVHINIPFEEPLYNQIPYQKPSVQLQDAFTSDDQYEKAVLDRFLSDWQCARRKIIICGLLPAHTKTSKLLAKLSEKKDVILLTETTSNIQSKNSIQCLDRVLHRLNNTNDYDTDLLISLGGPIVSKKIKQHFSKHKPGKQWYLDEGPLQDTYDATPNHLRMRVDIVLENIVNVASTNDQSFQSSWEKLQTETSEIHSSFISTAPFCDLTVFASLLAMIPDKTNLHLANSTPIRYAQLFDQTGHLNHFSNRGVSGIDGSTSTALGYASKNTENNVLVTGDMSFFYDSNAFWQKDLPPLLIILINNGGGGIFRYIPGPGTTDQLESVFEAHHELNAEHISKMYSLDYMRAHNLDELKLAMGSYYTDRARTSIIEVFTPRKLNAEVLKQYFLAMK